MSFLINTLYGKLELTDAEQATVNKALPLVSKLLDGFDDHLVDIEAIVQLLIKNQAMQKQLVADWTIVGPNLSAACIDGNVDLFGILGAFNDAKSVIAANPTTVQNATVHYNNLVPVVNLAVTNWPTIGPAVQIIMAAAHKSGVTADDMLSHFHDGILKNGK